MCRIFGVSVALLVFGALPATAQKASSVFTQKALYNAPGDGYMVGGEYWHTVKPMNSAETNGIEDDLANSHYLHWITMGPDGTDWRDPVGFWPGGHQLVSNGRDGWRMIFPVFEADDWANYGYVAGNPIYDALQNRGEEDSRFMFSYYSPNVPGAGDPTRDYKHDAAFTDASRSHLVYEAGWPTTTGIDFKIRAHQYTINEQNLNDFVALEVTMTNTGVVDSNGDGTPEATDHAIDAVALGFYPIDAWMSVAVRELGRRHTNDFGFGRTAGYYATPDASGRPMDILAWYGNVPPDRTAGGATPPPGTRLFGVMSYRGAEKGYTDVWNGWRWVGAKQGSYEDGVDGTSPDKLTLFGTHPVGEGTHRGWYGSAIAEASLVSGRAADKAFHTATATWYEDYGKESNNDTKDLSPNSAFFSGGTPDDMTTWVVGNPDARPNGDYKYASEEVPPGIEQPVWEPILNPGAADGSDFYGATGYNFEYTFGQAILSGIGPFSLDVGESMTVLWVCAGGFRATGLVDALDAAEWAWNRGWDISSELPTPPAPDLTVESTTAGTAKISWTDVSSIDSDVDGYKVWRASQFQVTDRLEKGFRALDNYQHVQDVGEDITPYLDPVNPWFDAESEFTPTQDKYQPAEWGTYDLIKRIPNSDLSQYQGDAAAGYDYSIEDPDAITGFTYWYYVSAYKEGSFSGPFGPIGVNHIESSNFNRNGRNTPSAAAGEIGLTSPWSGTYPYATRNELFPSAVSEPVRYQNLGAPFTVTPPVAPPGDVAKLITVNPNPYKVTGLNDVRTDASSHNIDFLNTPADFTLTILDVSGQIILQEEVTGAIAGKYTWDMFSKDGTEVASGLYIYHVEYSGGSVTGHFAILR
jgi:hypothetical protein